MCLYLNVSRAPAGAGAAGFAAFAPVAAVAAGGFLGAAAGAEAVGFLVYKRISRVHQTIRTDRPLDVQEVFHEAPASKTHPRAQVKKGALPFSL